MTDLEDQRYKRGRRLRLLAGGLILVVMAVLLSHQGEVLSRLAGLGPADLVVLLALSFLIILVLAVQFRYTVAMFGLHLDPQEWIGLTFINSMFSFYLPAHGGLFVRGAYLKGKRGFPVSSYTALTVTAELLMLAIAGLAGLLLLSGCGNACRPYTAILVLVFAAAFVSPLVLLFILSRLSLPGRRQGRFDEFAERLRSGVRVWFAERAGLVRFIILGLLLAGLRAVRLAFCFRILGFHVGVYEVLLVQLLLAASFVFSVTPGNLGVRELLVVLCAGVLGVTADAALAAAVIDRAAAMLVIFVAGGIYTRILLGRADEPSRSA